MNKEKEIIVVSMDQTQCQALTRLLEEQPYRVTSKNSLSNLKEYIEASACRAVVIDLDNLQITGRFFKDLKKAHPSLNIMGLSDRPFHPGLEEAIGTHIFACLKKPVDSDELFYLLKSAYENKTVPVESL